MEVRVYLLLFTLFLFGFVEGEKDENAINLIEKAGYPVEEHYITSEDGYILQLIRIPANKASDCIKNSPPVLLVTGLFLSAISWIISPKYSLAYLLSKSSYDVWMLNDRGTRYSRNHTTLSISDTKYWNFSWHEMGIYDDTAAIDYILNVTKFNKLAYICFSQGCTSGYVMLAEKPEYNDKIDTFIAYAAGIYLCHTSNPFLSSTVYIGSNGGIFAGLVNTLGYRNLIPFNMGLHNICESSDYLYLMCRITYDTVYVSTAAFTDKNTILNVFKYFPEVIPSKQLLHYAQCIQKCDFRRYQEFPNEIPPSYNLNNIKVPIYLFHGGQDPLQNPTDIKLFNETLPNGLAGLYSIDSFKHGDFQFAKQAKDKIYLKTLRILEKRKFNDPKNNINCQ